MKRLLFVLFVLATGTVLAQQPELLDHSIVGSESCHAGVPCYNEIIAKVPVQRLLLKLADAPMEGARFDATLRGTGTSPDDLLALHLVRREDSRYVLNFPLFTASDVRLIRAHAETYADSLAKAILGRRADIEAALSDYEVPGVDRKEVAYFLLGCVSLDWDGLEITAANHYRAVARQQPDGDYVPSAEEKTEQSIKGIYWGSNNARFGTTGFTSFGDHYSRRFGFPDLLWAAPGRIAPRDGDPEGVQAALRSFVYAAAEGAAADAGRIMLTLRDGERSADGIAAAVSKPVDQTSDMLNALARLGYVSEEGKRYRAATPVLTARDQGMSDRVREIGREVMERWLASNYPRIKTDLEGLSASRSGVPFEQSFTMVWHYIFGIANRKLVEAGLFADPYAAGRMYKGSVPAVYSLEY